jgi:hypothetical protein
MGRRSSGVQELQELQEAKVIHLTNMSAEGNLSHHHQPSGIRGIHSVTPELLI